MKKNKSTVGWILTWAGQKKSDYMWSVILAIANVVFRIIPYFMIAELFHSLSTTCSHKATFAVLSNIRKSCCDKLARVPLGYVKDTPSGSFKNIMVERIDSIETTLAHVVPEFTSNLLAPVIILIYFL